MPRPGSTITASTSTSTISANQFVQGGDAEKFAQNLAFVPVVHIGATIVNTIFQVFTIGLFTFYLVAEGPKPAQCLLCPSAGAPTRGPSGLGPRHREDRGVHRIAGQFLGIISGGAHSLAFVAIGLPSPLPLGIWVGFMSQFIPVVGTYLAGVLPLLIVLIDKPISGLWTLIFLVIYQQIENYFFLPRLTAHTMEIHVASAFGSVIIGAAVLLAPAGGRPAGVARGRESTRRRSSLEAPRCIAMRSTSCRPYVTSKRKRGQPTAAPHRRL